MFTGLVEAVGTVRGVSRRGRGGRLDLEVKWPDAHLPSRGDSVAVNGACLTVVEPRSDGFAADLSPETLARTLIGELRSGDSVNLERALRLGDRLGGHLVQGHVDTSVRLIGIARDGEFARWRFTLPSELAPQVAAKGSVCVHGVSLTVAQVGADSFEVALIPETLERTVLGTLRVGARVHLETDVLAKYVARMVATPTRSALAELWGPGGEHAQD